MRGVVVSCCVLFAAGCASASGLGVPELDANRLYHPKLRLEPAQSRLTVVDHRKPLPETSAETVANLRRALARVLSEQGIAVAAAAPHRLSVELQTTTDPPGNFSADDCIRLMLRLDLANGAFATSGAYACYGRRNLYGMSMGGDATATYEQVLNSSLQDLEQQRARLP